MKRIILIALFLCACEQDVDNIYYRYQEETNNMALNPSTNTEYVGRIVPPDANYPYGSAQDETVLGADDGTPNTAKFRSDVWGLCQGLLQKAGIVPDGNPDVAAGQYREALDTMPISLTQLADGDTSITAASVVFTLSPELLSTKDTGPNSESRVQPYSIIQKASQGATYQLESNLDDGGVDFTGVTPGTAVKTRTNSFPISVDTVEMSVSNDGTSGFQLNVNFVTPPFLTGIPDSTIVQGATLRVLEVGTTYRTTSINIKVINTGTDLKLVGFDCVWNTSLPSTAFTADLFLTYDPSLVD